MGESVGFYGERGKDPGVRLGASGDAGSRKTRRRRTGREQRCSGLREKAWIEIGVEADFGLLSRAGACRTVAPRLGLSLWTGQ